MSQPEAFPPAGGPAHNSGTGLGAMTAEPSHPPTSSKKKSVAGPRRVRLALTRINPFSAMKVAFLLSVAAGIMVIVAAAFIWFTLDALHVFSTITDLVGAIDSESSAFKALLEYMKFSRAISVATVIAVVNIVLTTALATIGAFLYNLTASLVGGVHLTLADE